MRLILTIFFLLLSTLHLYAVKAYPYPIKVKQPDGSILEIVMHGDEFFRYATTVDGRLVTRTSDGFYRYAAYSNGSILSSGTIARSSGMRFANMPLSANGPISIEETGRMRDLGIRRFEAAGGMQTMALRAVPGTVNALVIPVEFSDVRFTATDIQSHIQAMLNTAGYSEYGANGSAKDYFEANIPNTTFNFDVTPPVLLSKSMDYYGANDQSTPSVIIYDKNIREMVREACLAVNPTVDFSRYDNDNDGNVDYVFILYAGHNEAESGNTDAIWPQTYSIYNEGIRLDGVRLSLFGCSSELMGSDLSGDVGGNYLFAGIGNFCHEFSHSLGLKDLYDVNYGNGGNSKCLWERLSLMDEGNYSNFGRTPPYYCAIDRELAGTLEYEPVIADTRMTLIPINISNKAIRIPCDKDGEYFLAEARTAESWDRYINGSGMLIYHIDKSSNIVDGITASVRWENNLINTYAAHECADLVEAYPKAESISQVFFPGQAQITEFGPVTEPAFVSWDGIPAGYLFYDITAEGNSISFSVRKDNSEILLKPEDVSVKAYQTSAILEWDSSHAGIARWGIECEDRKDTTRMTGYVIEDLEPSSVYSCMIYHIGNYSNGDTVSVVFTTPGLSSHYPLMNISRKKLYEGDYIDLVMENITEEYASVKWFINGNEIYVRRAIFNYSGDYEIKAEIKYKSDNSTETITRIVTIHEREDTL